MNSYFNKTSTIDTTPPAPFTIEVINITTNGFTIIGAETTDVGTGIDRYEYYVNEEDKKSNIVIGLTAGTYSVYVKAVDKVGNYTNSNIVTVTIREPSKLSEEEQKELEKNNIKELNSNEISNENLKDNDNIKAVITGEVPIPEGFEYKEGTKETGVVVKFRDNEFVWVPIPEITEMARLQNGSTNNYQGVLYNFTGTGDTTVATERTTYGIGTISYREPDILTDGVNADGQNNLDIMNNILGTNYDIDEFKEQLQSDYNTMVNSVIIYRGFYIGRYETSVNLTTQTAYSKSGILPATAASDSANTWYGLYAYQKLMAEKNECTSIESHMIWGSQYDATLRWALTGVDKAKVTATGNAAHNLKGIYKTGNITVNGKVDRINNIYDLEGNGFEWTAEAYYVNDRCVRGGYYGRSEAPTFCSDNYMYPAQKHAYNCSRLTLYIKNTKP